MSKPYEGTPLWQQAFAPTGNEAKDRISAELAIDYGKMWDCACSLAGRIAADAPGLTLHDERHFRRLWECASMVAGPHYALSPIEAFVFGASILIHDAAHTVLAYEGGLAKIMTTNEWRDALAFRLLGEHGQPATDVEVNTASDEKKKAALFDTLRLLHAENARTMLGRPFHHPAFDTNLYLLENPNLRSHLGELIGDIAASHNWDLVSLAKLGRQKNAASPYHIFGPVRPLVVAALLRTADAVQIDHARATDFEMALHQPEGVSYDHWKAQNRLAIDVDSQDSSAALVTSTSAFREEDVRAWWIAYELAKTADHELQSSERFLRDNNETPFAVTRVKDAFNPAKFAEHVKTIGWVPANVEVRVTDAKKIIQMFGGAGLYGDDPLVPLRELIQNAADAIRPRRRIEPGFLGRIEVRLLSGENSMGEKGYWLEVADDGIGMSSAMLTGPFLSFGESGWSSDLLRRERPGLLGTRIKQIGRFGIGFFSAFMISEEVKVASRRYDDGLDRTKTLHFKKGLGMRPILREGGDGRGSMLTATRVSLFLKDETARLLLAKGDSGGRVKSLTATETPFDLRQLVAHVCPAIDSAIYTAQDNNPLVQATPFEWRTQDALEWLKRINNASDQEIPSVILSNLGKMELIEADGECIGRAALNPTASTLGTRTIGGFGRKRGDFINTFSNGFFGLLAMRPSGPRRDFGPWQNSEALREWAQRQLVKWSSVELEPSEKHMLAVRASEFGADPTLLANIQVGETWLSAYEFLDQLKSNRSFIAPIERSPKDPQQRYKIASQAIGFLGIGLFVEKSDWCFEDNLFTSRTSTDQSSYWEIPSGSYQAKSSFLACVTRLAHTEGLEIDVADDRTKVGRYLGPDVKRLRMSHGQEIYSSCITISLVRAGQ
jgi:hypothetical protein